MPEPDETPAPKWGDPKPLNLNQVTAAAIETLTELLQTDPEAVNALLRQRIPVSDAIVDHPHIQVSGERKLGGLGLINGILSRLQAPVVAMTISDAGSITGFSVYIPAP